MCAYYLFIPTPEDKAQMCVCVFEWASRRVASRRTTLCLSRSSAATIRARLVCTLLYTYTNIYIYIYIYISVYVGVSIGIIFDWNTCILIKERPASQRTQHLPLKLQPNSSASSLPCRNLLPPRGDYTNRHRQKQQSARSTWNRRWSKQEGRICPCIVTTRQPVECRNWLSKRALQRQWFSIGNEVDADDVRWILRCSIRWESRVPLTCLF